MYINNLFDLTVAQNLFVYDLISTKGFVNCLGDRDVQIFPRQYQIPFEERNRKPVVFAFAIVIVPHFVVPQVQHFFLKIPMLMRTRF